jgi:hypothetical protein
MARLKKVDAASSPRTTPSKFEHKDSWTNPEGFTISSGDFIKIKGKNSFGVGEWGITFKVNTFCTNIETGQEWVDCYEMYRGRAGVMRSFGLDRIKRIPKKRSKRVNRTNNN